MLYNNINGAADQPLPYAVLQFPSGETPAALLGSGQPIAVVEHSTGADLVAIPFPRSADEDQVKIVCGRLGYAFAAVGHTCGVTSQPRFDSVLGGLGKVKLRRKGYADLDALDDLAFRITMGEGEESTEPDVAPTESTDQRDNEHLLATNEKQHAARSLIRRGFRVFPTTADDPSLSPADIKKPLKGQSWLDLATKDEARVSKLWDKPYNIAIATGDGLLAIDVDVRKDGPKTLRDLERDHGPLPDTATTTTPTGGLHIFMRVPEGVSPRSGVDALGRGVDVKYRGGYVIAPGATIHGKAYVINGLPVADAPEWVVEMLAAKPEKATASKVPACELDTPANVNRATEWLNHAPEAIEGDGGDRTTYTVAAKLRSDFGLSEGVALDLMVGHWNERCSPPWDLDDLAAKVANAYRYGQGAPGGQTAEAEFEPVAVADRRSRTVTSDEDATWPSPSPVQPFEFADIPRRHWIVPGLLARRFATACVSPGGMGKTSLVLALAVAVASGKSEPIGREVVDRTPFWFWCQEDDAEELRRRLAAVMHTNDIGFTDLIACGQNMLHLNSGSERPLMLAKRGPDGKIRPTKYVDRIIRHIRDHNIGVFAFDPLVEFHEANENDNAEMKEVSAIARRIAVEGNCAVLVVGHTRKPTDAGADGHAGNIDSIRGASSQINTMRIAFTLYSMSSKDSKRYGIVEEDRRLYVRLDDGAKPNLMLPSGKPQWFRRTGVRLDNGEEVGVLRPVELEQRVSADTLLGDIEAVLLEQPASGEPHKFHDVRALIGGVAASWNQDNANKNLARALDVPWVKRQDNAGVTIYRVKSDKSDIEIIRKAGRGGTTIRLLSKTGNETNECPINLGD